MRIALDKTGEMPVYRQIMEQIAEKIQGGEIQPGHRLPTERELSIATGISRGTIKRAYDELSSEGIIERIQGSGTFASYINNNLSLSKKNMALELIDDMLSDLRKMHLSAKEINSLIGAKIQWRKRKEHNIHIAAIDCNTETLSLISEQLYKIPNAHVSELLISNLEKIPQKLTYGYDLILTTKDHYLRVIELAPGVADKVIKVAIVPSQKSLYLLSQIPEHSSIGIWCVSQEFVNIIYGRLNELHKQNLYIDYHLDCEPGSFAEFLEGKNVLILPSDYLGSGTNEDSEQIESFENDGGLVVYFEYLIDPGSLLYIKYEAEQRQKAKQAFSW